MKKSLSPWGLVVAPDLVQDYHTLFNCQPVGGNDMTGKVQQF